MHINKEQEHQILKNLANEWNKYSSENNIIVNSCILASNFASKTLVCVGVPHQVRVIGATVFNQRGFETFGTQPEELPEDAWSVHVSSLSRNDPRKPAFSGHVVIETENFFVDLTAEAFSRPQHQMAINDPLVVPKGKISIFSRGVHQSAMFDVFKSVDEFRLFNFDGVWYSYYYEDWNTIYTKSPDWRCSYSELGVRDVAGRICEGILLK